MQTLWIVKKKVFWQAFLPTTLIWKLSIESKHFQRWHAGTTFSTCLCPIVTCKTQCTAENLQLRQESRAAWVKEQLYGKVSGMDGRLERLRMTLWQWQLMDCAQPPSPQRLGVFVATNGIVHILYCNPWLEPRSLGVTARHQSLDVDSGLWEHCHPHTDGLMKYSSITRCRCNEFNTATQNKRARSWLIAFYSKLYFSTKQNVLCCRMQKRWHEYLYYPIVFMINSALCSHGLGLIYTCVFLLIIIEW